MAAGQNLPRLLDMAVHSIRTERVTHLALDVANEVHDLADVVC